MKFLQKLSKSFAFPISCLPISGMLIGFGYLFLKFYNLNSDLTIFLTLYNIFKFSGETIINNLPLLFVIGVSYSLSKENDISAIFSGIICWLIFQKMLNIDYISIILNNPNLDFLFNPNNVLIAIISGIIASTCFNHFKDTKFNEIFALFSGRRFVFIMSVLISILFSCFLILFLPNIIKIFYYISNFIKSSGPFGAFLYGFLNRALIPTGTHHSLNTIFLFDTIGINDMGNFWLGKNINNSTGIYMTGFYPITIFALPMSALAIYKTSKKENKKFIAKTLIISSISCLLTGVTETIEFAILLISPWLYILHCFLTGLSLFICAILPTRAGFSLSGGILDLIFSSLTPLSKNVIYIIPIGIIFSIIYYYLFKICIVKFNLKTIANTDLLKNKKEKNFKEIAKIIICALGGIENITNIDNCVTRLRIDIKDKNKVNEDKFKDCNISGIFYPSENSIHIVIGNNVQFIANEMKKQFEKN